jgi:lysophospholipase L1-like esterase
MRYFLSKSAKGIFIACAMLFTVELSCRLAAFAWYGFNEYYLFYGVHSWIGRVGINPRSTFEGAYYKFPPNYSLKGAAGQGSETASINSHGFRGPDFNTVKPKGVFRVICLGESSTFGYRNRDDETYPFILGKLFAREPFRVEVINAGFPYYNSGSILSLLKDDILNYEPDLITLYAGYNDTSWPIRIGTLGRVALWLQDHSMIYFVLRNVINQHGSEFEIRVVEKLMPQKLPREEVRRDSNLVAARYKENVQSIIRIAKSRAIPEIMIKQPVTGHKTKTLT